MTLYYPKPTEELLNALVREARYLEHQYARLASMLRRVQDALLGSARDDMPGEWVDHPLPCFPHRVRHIGVADLTHEDRLAYCLTNGPAVSWIVLAELDPGDVLNYAIEVRMGRQDGLDGEVYQFAELYSSPSVDAAVDVLRNPSFQGAGEAPLYLSAFRIDVLQITGFWLQANTADQSRIVLVKPCPSYLEPWPRSYSVRKFYSLLEEYMNEAFPGVH